MSHSPDIRTLSHDELCAWFAAAGENAFRADQVFDWLYKKGVTGFDRMRNLPAGLRDKLGQNFSLSGQTILRELRSADGTKKFLFAMRDGEKVETVLIPTATRATVCVSTQAGCKFGCKFCASGIGGWKRDLSSGEILAQVVHAKTSAEKRPVSHIVFMGTGEPLDNYDNLLKAVRTINAQKGFNIAARRITVSTCGVIPQIQRLAGEGLQIELAISLHGFNDESRKILMPVNKKYPFHDLMEACREYGRATKRQITFEYILIKDVTCTREAAVHLKKAFRGLICKMNLIPYNPVSEFGHKTPTKKEMDGFRSLLGEFGVHATVRTPRGRDVSAACGQLRHASQ